MRRHRGLAVGGDPGRRQTAVLARAEAQGALSLLLKDKALVDDAALAPAPRRRILLVDARPDGIDRGQVVAAHRFDAGAHLAAVRIEPVPQVAEPWGALGRLASRDRAG